jgi:hypothetical protein
MGTRAISGSFLDYIRTEHDGRVALVIGNGVHRYRAASTDNDWNAMVQTMARKYGLNSAAHARHLALTELYDLIDLKQPKTPTGRSLPEEFCGPMAAWKPGAHHGRIAAWASANNAPILTTNFDTVLADAVGARLQSMFQPHGALKRPTDYYPWEKYFSISPMDGPCDRFGIWHVNGFVTHHRSVRLGLTHYMGSVTRARPWLHGHKESRLFSEKNMPHWRGRNTWLHIVFNMPLVIMGLQLGAQEVFLRWLLIERARYFRQFPDRRRLAWYVHPVSENTEDDLAKYFFLEAIGVRPVAVKDFEDIYGEAAWAS